MSFFPCPDCDCGRSPTGPVPSDRIVGGTEATPHSHPWQVALVTGRNDAVYCGGTIINEYTIVTAAHCGDGSGRATILAGSHDFGIGQQKISGQFVGHKDYSSTKLTNDIAVIKLDQPLDLSGDAVRAACLPQSGQTFENELATVTGWGTTSSGGTQPGQLLQVGVTVQEAGATTCQRAYGTSTITPDMLCAYAEGKDSCQGDSGGKQKCCLGGAFFIPGQGGGARG